MCTYQQSTACRENAALGSGILLQSELHLLPCTMRVCVCSTEPTSLLPPMLWTTEDMILLSVFSSGLQLQQLTRQLQDNSFKHVHTHTHTHIHTHKHTCTGLCMCTHTYNIMSHYTVSFTVHVYLYAACGTFTYGYTQMVIISVNSYNYVYIVRAS